MLGQTPICKITQALHLSKNQKVLYPLSGTAESFPLVFSNIPGPFLQRFLLPVPRTRVCPMPEEGLCICLHQISVGFHQLIVQPLRALGMVALTSSISVHLGTVSYLLRVQEAQPVCATSPVLGVKHMIFSSTCLAQLSFICDAACPAVKHLGFGGCTVKAIQCSGRVGTSEGDTQHPCSVLPRAAKAGDTGGQKPQILLQEG